MKHGHVDGERRQGGRMIRMRSLRQKLLGVVMLSTLVALLVSLATIVAYDLRAYHQSVSGDMSTQSELIGHMSSAALAFDDKALAKQTLSLLRLRPKINAGAIYNAKGKLFASYVAPGQDDHFPQQAEADAMRFEDGKLTMFKRIVDNGELQGTVYLRAEYEMVGRLGDYLGIALLVMLPAMGIAYLIMRRTDYIITRPILDIRDVAREVVQTGDYSRRAAPTSEDEVAQLVESFNSMLSEVEIRQRELAESNSELAREAEQRTLAQQEVMRLNEELEQRVHERTLQLEATNGELAMAMEEAKSANQAKSAFLSSMSHELRTPLNAILGFAQILTSDKLPSTLVQKKEFANHILKSGRHLLTLINEILDLAKIESGAVALSMEPVALQEMLQEVQSMTEPLAAARGIRMLFPDNCRATVGADRTRLKQVLLNLLSNAIKYNREGGAVVVDCSSSAPGLLRLSVQDTGIGLKPDQVAMLFQPFNRLGQETGPEEGTGIGLVVTKRLVELMGGVIGASSSQGVGSLFWIELRATEPLPSLDSETARALADNAGQHAPDAPAAILYVEDNPANLKLVEEIISFRPDLRLLSAPDAHLGVELARAHQPDIILMDINLPGMSGLDAMRVLRSDSRTQHIPVIALTANAMPRDIEKGVAAGFFRYLIKPINIDEFTEAINSTLAHIAERGDRKASKELS
ncbi:ATP-binding protein [Massilia sp. Root418]|jgi:signal transduction histidine kinase/AmiR/NasT family two-component response regulator|uniref:ATP-binding protein n=1 Tax=Massilia sp. Root418 TaxID=1736532 RepID=UPI000AA87DB0|nr:ATP-binding protein [Massilia sp. Root418]